MSLLMGGEMVKAMFIKPMSRAESLEFCDFQYARCIQECEYVNALKFKGDKNSQFYKVCMMTCENEFKKCVERAFRFRGKQGVFLF